MTDLIQQYLDTKRKINSAALVLANDIVAGLDDDGVKLVTTDAESFEAMKTMTDIEDVTFIWAEGTKEDFGPHMEGQRVLIIASNDEQNLVIIITKDLFEHYLSLNLGA